jgi:hypothetical protein
MSGRKRLLRRDDVDRILAKASRQPNGKYRALASRFADGRRLGYFKYYGTRPDDPNDIHPHEHRRELRGSRVFAAWLNHDDSRGLNSLDMLQQADGRAFVRHYMFDFGSIMAAAARWRRPRAGNEYIRMEARIPHPRHARRRVRPWALVRYPRTPARWAASRAPSSIRSSGSRVPNPAFDNMRGDDGLWARESWRDSRTRRSAR